MPLDLRLNESTHRLVTMEMPHFIFHLFNITACFCLVLVTACCLPPPSSLFPTTKAAFQLTELLQMFHSCPVTNKIGSSMEPIHMILLL